MGSQNSEEFIKNELKKYIDGIEIPQNLEGIMMNNIENEINEEKKKMSKTKKIIAGAACFVVVAGAVGTATFVGLNQKDKEPVTSTANSQVATENTPAASQTEVTVTKEGKLTSNELKEIEEFLLKMEVNGFVSHNIYDKPENIDLTEVFYNHKDGNHNKYPGINEEYLKFLNGGELQGAEELPTDFSVVSPSEVKEIYKKYTGKNISDADIKNRLNWDYLAKYDVYCYLHGDTNYIPVKCVSGIKKSDNTYIVTLNFDGMYYNDKEVKETELTLQKNGTSYIFISNVISGNENISSTNTIKEELKSKRFMAKNNIDIGSTARFMKIDNNTYLIHVAHEPDEFNNKSIYFIATYKNGNVIFDKGLEHKYEYNVSVDNTNKILKAELSYKGCSKYTYYNIANGEFSVMDDLSKPYSEEYIDTVKYMIGEKEVSKNEFEQTNSKYSKYNFINFESNSVELNDTNIDKLVR